MPPCRECRQYNTHKLACSRRRISGTAVKPADEGWQSNDPHWTFPASESSYDSGGSSYSGGGE